MALLDPGLLRKLASLSLWTRKRAVGVNLGERRSIRRGQSQEFADHRPYVPGDDLRFLDWHLFGRLDALWIKLFEEEQDRTIQVLLDSSASMDGVKLQYARQLAAALSYVALNRSDRVAIASLSDRLASYSPPRRGRGAVNAIFRTIEEVRPGGRTDLGQAFASYPRQRGAGIGLLFTDFLYDEGPEVPLRRLLSRGMELHAFHIFAPAEIHPGIDGDLLLVDAETGEGLKLTVTPEGLRRYEDMVETWADTVLDTCRRLGVGYTRVVTSVPVEELILRDLRRQRILQ